MEDYSSVFAQIIIIKIMENKTINIIRGTDVLFLHKETVLVVSGSTMRELRFCWDGKVKIGVAVENIRVSDEAAGGVSHENIGVSDEAAGDKNCFITMTQVYDSTQTTLPVYIVARVGDPECFPRIRIRYYHSGSGSDQYKN